MPTRMPMTNLTFFQERVVDGVLKYRDSPAKPWVEYTKQELTERLEVIQKSAAVTELETLREQVADLLTQQKQLNRQLLSFQNTELPKAVEDATKKLMANVLAIIDTEEELSGSPTESERQQLRSLDPVDLARVVVRTTKKSIRERITS